MLAARCAPSSTIWARCSLKPCEMLLQTYRGVLRGRKLNFPDACSVYFLRTQLDIFSNLICFKFYICMVYGAVSPEQSFVLSPHVFVVFPFDFHVSAVCGCVSYCSMQEIDLLEWGVFAVHLILWENPDIVGRSFYTYASMIQWAPFQFCSEMSQVSSSSALSSFSSWSRHGMSFRSVKWRMWRFATCPVRRCGLCTTPHSCSFGGHLWWFAGDAPFAAVH